ncbi:MAG: hypothetical protein AAGI30_10010 [Planctomycetota bacterium]
MRFTNGTTTGTVLLLMGCAATASIAQSDAVASANWRTDPYRLWTHPTTDTDRPSADPTIGGDATSPILLTAPPPHELLEWADAAEIFPPDTTADLLRVVLHELTRRPSPRVPGDLFDAIPAELRYIETFDAGRTGDEWSSQPSLRDEAPLGWVAGPFRRDIQRVVVNTPTDEALFVRFDLLLFTPAAARLADEAFVRVEINRSLAWERPVAELVALAESQEALGEGVLKLEGIRVGFNPVASVTEVGFRVAGDGSTPLWGLDNVVIDRDPKPTFGVSGGGFSTLLVGASGGSTGGAGGGSAGFSAGGGGGGGGGSGLLGPPQGPFTPQDDDDDGLPSGDETVIPAPAPFALLGVTTAAIVSRRRR